MPTLGRIPLTRHTRRRTARKQKARIEDLQRLAAPHTLTFEAHQRVAPNDRIEVERSWRGPYMWQVVAYREQP
jgi:hypothetical protein